MQPRSPLRSKLSSIVCEPRDSLVRLVSDGHLSGRRPMPTYAQYCPVARGAEIIAERWTPIIMRNILWGCSMFSDIAAGAPGISRALLVKRLRALEHAGLIEASPKLDGHGSL